MPVKILHHPGGKISRHNLSMETGFKGEVKIPSSLHQSGEPNMNKKDKNKKKSSCLYCCLSLRNVSHVPQLLKENIPTDFGTFCGSWSERRASALCTRASTLSCLELSLQTQWVHFSYYLQFQQHCGAVFSLRRIKKMWSQIYHAMKIALDVVDTEIMMCDFL